MNKIEQMNDAVRQSRERHEHINRLRDAELDRLDRAIVATTLELIHDTGTASSWRVYVAMHPRVSFETFKFIERTSFKR